MASLILPLHRSAGSFAAIAWGGRFQLRDRFATPQGHKKGAIVARIKPTLPLSSKHLSVKPSFFIRAFEVLPVLNRLAVVLHPVLVCRHQAVDSLVSDLLAEDSQVALDPWDFSFLVGHFVPFFITSLSVFPVLLQGTAHQFPLLTFR